MKHLKLFFALFAMLALGVGNAWGAEVFKETFANSTGTAGFSGSAANGTFKADNDGWTTQNPYGAEGAAKFGASKKIGEAETPSISCGSGVTSATLTFKSGAWSGDAKTLKLSYTNCSGAATVTLKDAQWSDYTVELTDIIGDIKIKFTGNASSKARFFLDDVIVTVAESTDEPGTEEPALSSIEISGDLTNKTYEEGEELDFSGLTVQANYENGDPKDVTNDVEWSYTPALTKGLTSVEVTATYEEQTANKTIEDLTVNEHIVTPGEYCITPNNTFWGTSYTGEDAKEITNVSGKQNDISVLMTKSGQYGYINASQTRVYADYTMLFSVPAGYAITKIVFTADGANWKGTHTADVGEMTADSKTWTGANQNVTITFGGTCRITNICVTYIKDVKYALTITEPTEGGTLVVEDGENTLTSGAEIYEGTKLTVTATPETGYEEGVVVVKNASDEDVTADVYEAGTLTMPAYAVTISATFEKKPCTLLTTPVVTATPTYNSATLTWDAVANAAKYSVTVGETTTEVTEPTFTATGLNAETTYTYQVQAIAEAEQDTYCDSEVAEGTFTTATAPTATLTLKDIVGTTTQIGALNGTIILPTTAAECSKTFVGWDADEDCDHAPTYAPGAEYTLAAETQTLYAVYANGESGESVTIFSETFDSCTGKGGNDTEGWSGDIASATLNLTGWSCASGNAANGCAKFGTGSKQGSAETPAISLTGAAILTFKAAAWNGSNEGTTLNVSATGATLDMTSVTLTKGSWNTYTVAITNASGSVKVKFEAKNASNNRFFLDDVVISQASVTYSDYSTTCTAALDAPTFTPVEGTYNEVTNVTISAEDGATIYYTTDGTEPTNESTEYSSAIVLDQCGETTIKAIAISADNQSPVAEATYTINLSIANTAATAYTPAEAVAIIDGECDLSETVFVKGVVLSTSEFSEEYGNYNVVVKGVDDNSATPTQFTFYRMYKGADKTKFTTSDKVIGIGDVITATGTLTKYGSTYELADGCYMVEHIPYEEEKTDISNTEATAYTVAKAQELIDDVTSDLTKQVYVKGIVSKIVTAYNSEYGNITYNISADGLTTSAQLQAYRGKSYDGDNFTSADDIQVGDEVVVYGLLGKYYTTYQLGEDNQLVSLVRPEQPEPEVSVATLPFSYDGNGSGLSDVTGVSAEGVGNYTSSPAIKFDGTGDYMIIHFDSEPGKLSYLIKDNGFSGGTFTVQESADGNTYTNVVVYDDTKLAGTLTEEYTLTSTSRYVKFIYTEKSSGNVALGNINIAKPNAGGDDIEPATLPFSYDSNGSGLSDVTGVSAEGVGNYTSSPAIKFDGTGDYMIIHFDSEPGKLSYLIKDNDFSGGTFTVQESADGNTYTNVVVYDDTKLAGTLTEEYTLTSTSRYVKFIYTEKSSGNVALGNISITKYGESTEPEPELTNATYEKVTAEPTDWSGEYILVYDNEDNNNCYVWTGVDEVNGHTATTRDGNTISGTFVTITIAPMTGGYSVQVNGGTKNGKYVGGTSEDNAIVYSDSEILNTITYYPVGIDLTSNTSVMRFNAATNQLRFRYYQSGQSAIQLYKKLSPIEIGEADNSTALATTGSVDVEVTRQFTADNLYTIALPFALNNVAEIFGAGTVVYEYAQLAQEGADVVLYFKKVNALESGKPYLIEPTQDVPGFTVEDVTLSSTTNNISFTAGQTTVSMNAILTTSGSESTNGTTQYWLDADRWLRNGTTTILGLRALFEMTTISGMPPRARVSLGENGTTGIEDIITTDAPQKVIVNGQLIIIRNGEKFNVQGQLIK